MIDDRAVTEEKRTRRPWRRCSSCRGICHWHDEAWVCDDCGEAWVCDDCGDEWMTDHDPRRYAAPGGTEERLPSSLCKELDDLR